MSDEYNALLEDKHAAAEEAADWWGEDDGLTAEEREIQKKQDYEFAQWWKNQNR